MGDAGDDERSTAEADAAERGRAIVAEARAVRRRMLDDAEQRRRALVAELEEVRAHIDEAITALNESGSAAAPGTSDEPTAVSSSPPTEPEGAGPAPEAAASEPPERVDALFDSLRAETPPPAPKPRRPSKPSTPAGPAQAAAEIEPAPAADAGGAAPVGEEPGPGPGPEPEPAPEAEAPGDAIRRRRDALLEPLVPDVVRSSKRLLQDEQNSLLDSARRARGRHEPARLLPEPVRQRETWTALLAPSIDAAYLGGRAAAGKTGRVTSAPTRLVVELAALLVTPLRERVLVTIDSVVGEGPYESANELQRALGSAIGARFREWRTVDLEEHVVDVLSAAYARGAYDGAGPAAMLRWIPAEPGRCPDCDDNALEPTLKGNSFPTGQPHPPAHPGCRCVIVPADD